MCPLCAAALRWRFMYFWYEILSVIKTALLLTFLDPATSFPKLSHIQRGTRTPPPRTSLAPPQLNSVGLLLLACAVCTVLELQCAALSPSCTLKPTEQCSPRNNVLLFTNRVAPVHAGSGLAHGRRDILFSQSWVGASSSSTSPLNRAYFTTAITCVPVVDAKWRESASVSPRQASLCCPAC